MIPRIESAEVGSNPLAYLIRPGSDFRGDRIRCDTRYRYEYQYLPHKYCALDLNDNNFLEPPGQNFVDNPPACFLLNFHEYKTSCICYSYQLSDDSFTIFGYSRMEMASHSLVAVVILAMSCIVPSTCSNDGAKTYSARVLNTTQGECLSDAQREATIAEVQEDIRNLLNSRK